MSNTENWIFLGSENRSSFGFNSEPSSYSEVPNVTDKNTDFQINPDGTFLAIPIKKELRNLNIQQLSKRLKEVLGDQEKPVDTE